MRERLQELRGELERGREHLAALDRERADARDTMLRISGAMQVLEELLGERGDGEARTPRPPVALAG